MYEGLRNSGEGGGNKSPTTLILPGLEIKSKDYYMNPQIVRPSYGPAFELCRRPESLTNCGHDNQRLNQKKKNGYSPSAIYSESIKPLSLLHSGLKRDTAVAAYFDPSNFF